jgi:hypothetical protein
MKTLADSGDFTENRIIISFLAYEIFVVSLSTCQQFRENALLFKITGGFLNAATSILKRVSVRIFKISKCFHKSKQKI